MRKIRTPLEKKDIKNLKVGQQVLLSGTLYTARDQAHRKLVELIRKNKKLPLQIKSQIIYYCGPTATAKGKIIGSCGPTTSRRMDGFIEPLVKKGLAGMIGKGRRSKEVKQLTRKYKTIYFLAPSGCGAYLAGRVKKKRLVAFGELGPEAIYELEVENFPLIVGIDTKGRDIYERLAYGEFAR